MSPYPREARIDSSTFVLDGGMVWARFGQARKDGKLRIRLPGVGCVCVEPTEVLEVRPVFYEPPEVAALMACELGELEVMIETHPRYWRQRPSRIRQSNLARWREELGCERLMAIPVGPRERMTPDEIAAILGGDA